MKRPGRQIDAAGLALLSRGLMTCPTCTVQREARLKAELEVPALRLALARAIWGRRDVVPSGLGRSWAAEYRRITGIELEVFVTALASSGPADPRKL